MDAVVEEADFEDIVEEIRAPAEVLPPGIDQPINIIDGKPELILPSDHTKFTACAEQCFRELAKTRRFFRQGSAIVELAECSEGLKLVELTVEAFRSRLESYFTLRSYVSLRGGGLALRPKICSQDNAKALLATEAALKYLPPIQAIVNSPVFAEEEGGNLTILNQGYHTSNGGIYVLRKRNIDTTIEASIALKELLNILEDFSFLTESDKSRCVAGLISPALRFGRLLDTDFPLDLCEADKSQTGKSFRMKLISQIYGEQPFVVVLPSESKKGVASLDESLSEALLSGAPFIVLENVRGQIASQLLESAIRGEGKVSVRRAYSRTTLIDTNHVYWMATSNRAQMTQDLANRSIITRLRKRPFGASFKEYPEGDLLKHVEVRSDYILSCIYAVIREWHSRGKCRTQERRHDFREWSQTLDWIIQEIFKLPPLLEGHQAEQLRISSSALSFLRELALVVQKAGDCNENLSTTDLAFYCSAEGIEVPGCAPGADSGMITRRIGSILAPLFREPGSIQVEGFLITRIIMPVYNEERKENVLSKFYCFEPWPG
jgi:hypothetical protein